MSASAVRAVSMYDRHFRPTPINRPAPTSFSDFEVRIIPVSGPNLILRSIAQAMRLEGWKRAMVVQAAILRDVSRRLKGRRLAPQNELREPGNDMFHGIDSLSGSCHERK
jgi:hypothetical protein